MRKTKILILTTLVSTSILSVNAVACPTFNAKYKCAYEDGPRVIELKSRIDSGIFVYNYNGSDIKADGVSRPYSATQQLLATCANETVTLNFVQDAGGMSSTCSTGAKSFIYQVNWTKKGNTINEHNVGSIVCMDGSSLPVGTGDYVCTEQ